MPEETRVLLRPLHAFSDAQLEAIIELLTGEVVPGAGATGLEAEALRMLLTAPVVFAEQTQRRVIDVLANYASFIVLAAQQADCGSPRLIELWFSAVGGLITTATRMAAQDGAVEPAAFDQALAVACSRVRARAAAAVAARGKQES